MEGHGGYGRRTGDDGHVMRDVFLPPHLYGQLAQTKYVNVAGLMGADPLQIPVPVWKNNYSTPILNLFVCDF
jgi:hypothetical protein